MPSAEVNSQNRQWLLKTYPPEGTVPGDEIFEFVTTETPAPGDGEVLIRALYLSLDPYIRGRISPAKNYAPGVKEGAVVTGRGIGEIALSKHPDFSAGDVVLSELGWQDFRVADGAEVQKIAPSPAPLTTAVGILGMPGLTAYFGLLRAGRPEQGNTVLVTAASGAVGGCVGQIARILGCRTIAIAGSDAKIDYCTSELGYDAGINYKTAPDLSAAVAAAAPGGVDVFFDNVGGIIHQTVIGHLALGARVVQCGVISAYSDDPPPPYNLRNILVARATVTGILVTDWADEWPDGLAELGAWYADGKLKYRETVADGLEAAPAAFRGLLLGENFGKQLVKIAEPPA